MRFGGELLIQLFQRLELAPQFDPSRERVLLGFLHLAAKIADLDSQRIQKLIEIGLVLLRKLGGLLVEDLACQSLKLMRQLGPCIRQYSQFLLRNRPFALEFGLQPADRGHLFLLDRCFRRESLLQFLLFTEDLPQSLFTLSSQGFKSPLDRRISLGPHQLQPNRTDFSG